MTVINTNTAALMAERRKTTNKDSMATAMERLSTGTRVNRAADDGAAMAQLLTGLQTSIDKYSKFSSNPIITGNLALQDARIMGNHRDTQLVGNWGLPARQFNAIQSQEMRRNQWSAEVPAGIMVGQSSMLGTSSVLGPSSVLGLLK